MYNKRYAKPRTKTAILKELVRPLKNKYKGFKFEVTDGTAIVIEIKLPFRIFKYIGSNRMCDDEAYEKIQRELRNKVAEVYPYRNLIVVECQFIQIHVLNTDKLDELCEVTKNFIEDKYKVYGQYIKNGKKIGVSIDKNISDLDDE